MLCLDCCSFYAENGLIVLNDWLSDSLQRKETGLTKQKRVAAMYSQVRALLRVRVDDFNWVIMRWPLTHAWLCSCWT